MSDQPEEQLTFEEALARLEEHVGEGLGAGREIHGKVEIGHPFKEIVGAVEGSGSRLLVLGSHGLGTGDPKRAGTFASRCVRKAMVDVVQSAYQRLIAELEIQAAIAPKDDGVWKFDNGDAFYAERLRWFTTTDLSADEIHTIGLREVARVQGEMKAIMAQVGFEGSLAEFFVFLREDPQFYYPDTDAGREAYLAEGFVTAETRIDRLQRGVDGLVKYADRFSEALNADFTCRPREVTLLTDIGAGIAPMKHAIKHVRKWMKPEKRPTVFPFNLLGGRSRMYLVLLSESRAGLHGQIDPWLPRIRALPGARKVRWSVDIDPQEL